MNNIKKVVVPFRFWWDSSCRGMKSKGHDVTLIEKQNDLGDEQVFKKEGYTMMLDLQL